MRPLTEKSRQYSVLLIPSCISIALMVLCDIHFGIPGLAQFMPLLVLMNVFYWLIFWPEAMPKSAVLLIGLFQDMIVGTPFGVSAFLYLLLWWVLVEYRKHFIHSTFPALWISLSGAAFIYIFVVAGFYMYDYEHFAVTRSMLLQWVFTILLYPALHRFLYAVHTRLLRIHA